MAPGVVWLESGLMEVPDLVVWHPKECPMVVLALVIQLSLSPDHGLNFVWHSKEDHIGVPGLPGMV